MIELLKTTSKEPPAANCTCPLAVQPRLLLLSMAQVTMPVRPLAPETDGAP
jgi:hypothetical protein